MNRRITIAMTGATGQVYGIRALELLGETDVETHLILSETAARNIDHETDLTVEAVRARADTVYEVDNTGAPIASGSYRTDGMLVAPCSMKTLSKIATGDAGNLITRTADVMLKERNTLVLMPREKPFSRIHLQNMLAVTDAGGIIMPPFPSFYQTDSSLSEMITRTMARTLRFFDAPIEYEEWDGLPPAGE